MSDSNRRAGRLRTVSPESFGGIGDRKAMCGLFFGKRIGDFFRQSEADSWQAGDLLGWHLLDALDRSEMLEKSSFAGGTDPRNVIEQAFSDAFFE